MIHQKPKVSIITVVFNAEALIRNTIESIVQQTYENIEYIVIDGKSKDATLDIVKEYSKKIATIVSEPDSGIYDAMNKGLRLATGDYVWFVNAGDCLCDKDTVEKLFISTTDADVYYGKTNIRHEDGRLKKTTSIPKVLTSKSYVKGMVVSHQGIVIRRSLTGPYDLKYKVVSDHDWIISALKKAHVICRVEHVLVDYLAGGFSEQRFGACWVERFAIIRDQFGLFYYLINYGYFIRDFTKRKLKNLIKR